MRRSSLPAMLAAAALGCAAHAPARLAIEEAEDGCSFDVELEPGEDGALRIPRQRVTPIVCSTKEDEAP